MLRRGVACGVAYAYNSIRTDRPFAATTLFFETTAFSAGAISAHRSTNPPGIEFPGTAIEYVRVGRQLNTHDQSLHACTIRAVAIPNITWLHAAGLNIINKAAKRCIEGGCSLRDVQQLAGHSSLATTQRYIEGSSDAKRRIVDLIS